MSKKNITVFNEKGEAHKTGDYPLFGGEEASLYDSVNKPYPYLYELMEKLKQNDWSPQDVDLTQTRMDLLRCNENTRELMLLNLAYQWSIDSIATSIPTLLAPFVSNTEYGHLVARIGENECLHSESYSDIVRNCVPDPQEVFDMVYKNEQVLERSKIIAEVLSNLKKVGAEYTLGIKTFDECAPYILKGLIAIYSLERISFMSSFACTFALAEQDYFVGAARLVQKILIDEMVHFEAQRYALREILLKDEYWVNIFNTYKTECEIIVGGVVSQETSWNKYLFSGGRSIVGLNEGILNDWTRYCAQDVIDNLNMSQMFRKTVTCPLKWFEADWMDLNSQQNANMEADNINYMVSAVSRDVSDVDLSEFAEFFGTYTEGLSSKRITPEFRVYTKEACPYCIILKNFMDDNNFTYQAIDVDENPDAKLHLLDRGLKTVPQVFDHEGLSHIGDCTTFIYKYEQENK